MVALLATSAGLVGLGARLTGPRPPTFGAGDSAGRLDRAAVLLPGAVESARPPGARTNRPISRRASSASAPAVLTPASAPVEAAAASGARGVAVGSVVTPISAAVSPLVGATVDEVQPLRPGWRGAERAPGLSCRERARPKTPACTVSGR